MVEALEAVVPRPPRLAELLKDSLKAYRFVVKPSEHPAVFGGEAFDQRVLLLGLRPVVAVTIKAKSTL